ncbi:hypothetical protein V493_02162 [Pseudogymnoascus sp. VKM F-4281 (FW-2241)]|nr:hypothetical protein V493_02162 [Pseudogymnoascus sp. VKM F-4281 (FW-2241)]
MGQYVRQAKSLPKHPKTPASSDSPFAVAPAPVAPRQRPGWSGPGYTKKGGKHIPRPPPAPKPVVIPPGDEHQALEAHDQQLLLDVVRKAFPKCEEVEALKVVLGEVEEAMKKGDWQIAFGDAEKREAWVVMWGAERAVWFANLLVKVVETLEDDPLFAKLRGKEENDEEEVEEEEEKDDEDEDDKEPLRVVSFGGGPAEVLALGGVIRHFRSDAHGKSKAELESSDSDSDAGQIIDLNLANTVNWTREVSTSLAALLSPPTLSKYASASAIANSAPFLAKSALVPEMHRFSALEASQEEVGELVGEEAALITLFYTVADLAATSVAKTVALLLKLTIAAPKGSLVVVFDHAEEEGKKGYPLRYLLDMAFLGKKPSGEDEDEGVKPAWKMLLAEDDRVVKVSDGLRYAMGLETAKAQVYVFRRL